MVYAKRAAVLYFAGASAAIAGLCAWALLAAPDSSPGVLILGAGGSLFFLYAAAWIVLRYRGPILGSPRSGLTYYSRRGLLLRAELGSVAWDAIAHVSSKRFPVGAGRRSLLSGPNRTAVAVSPTCESISRFSTSAQALWRIE